MFDEGETAKFDGMPRWFRPRIAVGGMVLATVFFVGLFTGMGRSTEDARDGYEGTEADDPHSVERDVRDATERLADLQFWTLIASTLTVGLLGLTFWETRKTANASTRATNASVAKAQPYLFATVSDMPLPNSSDQRRVTAIVTNIGGTPAQHVSIVITSPRTGSRREMSDGVLGPSAPYECQVHDLPSSQFSRSISRGEPFHVTISGTYWTTIEPVEERKYCVTSTYTKRVTSEGASFVGWVTSLGEYDAARELAAQNEDGGGQLGNGERTD